MATAHVAWIDQNKKAIKNMMVSKTGSKQKPSKK